MMTQSIMEGIRTRPLNYNRNASTIAVLSDSIGWGMLATISISALTQISGVATATSTAHRLLPGDTIFVVYCGAGYNGWRRVIATPTVNTFTFACDPNAAATATLSSYSEAAVAKRHVATNWINWAISSLNFGIRWEDFGQNGIGGETSSQILSRVTDVVSCGAKYCVVISGHNDLLATTGNPETAFNNVRNTWEYLRGHGVIPIASTCELDSGFAATDATKRKTILQLNAYIKDYCFAHGIKLLDLRALFADPTSVDGLSKTVYHVEDRLHPNIYGAKVIGEALADLLRNDVSSVSYLPETKLVDSAREYFSNPLMGGSDGICYQCTGTLPTNMIGALWGGSGAWVGSVVARTLEADGDTIGYNAVLSSNNAQTTDGLELTTSSMHETINSTAPTAIRAVCHFKLSGAHRIGNYTVGFVATVDGVEILVSALEAYMLHTNAPTIDIKLETPKFNIPTGTLSDLRFVIRCLNFTETGSVSVSLGRLQVFAD